MAVGKRVFAAARGGRFPTGLLLRFCPGTVRCEWRVALVQTAWSHFRIFSRDADTPTNDPVAVMLDCEPSESLKAAGVHGAGNGSDWDNPAVSKQSVDRRL
eukprot:gene28369-50211_t